MLQQKLIVSASSGTFYLLPPITRSLEKLYRLIDEEMQSIGAQKVTMPCLAPHHLWNASGTIIRMPVSYARPFRTHAKSCIHVNIFSVRNKHSEINSCNLPLTEIKQIGSNYISHLLQCINGWV